jgi:hypothetical protein
MRMLDELRRKKNVIEEIGARERAAAHADGKSVYYMEPSSGLDIVEEMPDGTKKIHPHSVVARSKVDAAE